MNLKVRKKSLPRNPTYKKEFLVWHILCKQFPNFWPIRELFLKLGFRGVQKNFLALSWTAPRN